MFATGSVACSSGEGGTGGGGTGGGGTGGGGTGGGGTGGSATTATSATGGPGECVVENVDTSAGDPVCDPACNTSYSTGQADDVAMCTSTCDPAGDGAECGALDCVPLATGTTGICLYTCGGGAACPGTGEYVCNQDILVCVPDGLSD